MTGMKFFLPSLLHPVNIHIQFYRTVREVYFLIAQRHAERSQLESGAAPSLVTLM